MAVHHPGLQMSMDELLAVVRRQTIAALQNAAIGEDGLRFYEGGRATFMGGGGVEIQAGGFIDGIGDFSWTGDWALKGSGEITGKTTLKNDLEVLPGGKIKVGGMTIDPSDGGGSVVFSNGAKVRAGSGGVELAHGASTVLAASDQVRLRYGGFIGVTADAGGVRLAGVSDISGTGLPPGVLVQDGGGYIRRAA